MNVRPLMRTEEREKLLARHRRRVHGRGRLARVRAVLTGIRPTTGTAQRQVSAASIGEIRRMVTHMPEHHHRQEGQGALSSEQKPRQGIRLRSLTKDRAVRA